MKKTLVVKFFVVLFLVSLFFSDSTLAEPKKNMTLNPDYIKNFQILAGETKDDLTYNQKGYLLYKNKPFVNSIKLEIQEIPKVDISLNEAKGVASAVGLDIDGKNELYFLDLVTLKSIKIGVCPSSKVFWTPSSKYMVALCSSDFQWFVRIDLATKKTNNVELIPEGKKMLIIQSEPQWVSDNDTLSFIVAKTCNPYEDRTCTGNKINKIISRYNVLLDIEKMQFQFTKKHK